MAEMDFSSHNPASSNVLSLAARTNDVYNVQRYLGGYDPNLVDNRGWTCLHEAAYADAYECVVIILKHPKTRPRAETHEGHTALYLACKNNCSIKTIKILLNSVKNIVNYGSTEGVTPLHIASAQGNVELVELLLQYGAIMDVQDFDGDTPLHEAVLAAQHAVLVTLLYAGVDPEIKNVPGGFTPFHLACCKGYFPNVESLFPFVSDINQQTSSGDTALHFALHTSSEEIIYFLLENGADPHIQNQNGEMPIDLALGTSADVFNRILAITDRSKISRNIFVNACKPHKFQFHILEILLSSDLGPEYFNISRPFDQNLNDGYCTRTTYLTHSPLNHYLDISGYIFKKSPEKFKEFFYLLLMKGCDVNPIRATECSSLVYAHYVHHTDHLLNSTCFKEVFEILIEQGCDVDFCSSGKGFQNDICISDAFLTSLDMYPQSSQLMMPYSIYNEPDRFLLWAVKHNMLVIMPYKVQRELLKMVDKSFENIPPDTLKYRVPCLKHLSRVRVRSILRHMTTGRNYIHKFTTTTFLRKLDKLPVPPIIRDYLRYIEY